MDQRPELAAASDAVLWRSVKGGDADAFTALYHRHADRLYNYLFRRLGDWHAAEDLVAIVFLEAFRRRNDAKIDEDKILPWLFGVATNLAAGHSRSMRRARRLGLRLVEAAAVSRPAGDAAERAEAGEQMHRVLRHTRGLPRDQRDVIALCIWSGLSYEDAAHALRVPVGTIRSRLGRARQSLAELESAAAARTTSTVSEVNS